jgi:hypothetical protein
MALQKNVTSTRTGAVLSYHEIMQVSFGGSKATIVVASYIDKAAKDAGKQFADISTVSVDYAGENIGPKSVQDWAQEKALENETFQGAIVVA